MFEKNKIERILPLGLGSNVLVNNKRFDGVVLWFSKGEFSNIKFGENDSVEAFASDSLDDLINFSFDNNLIGLEWAGGLPSTVGGTVRGNVGAFGGEISKSLDSIEVFEVRKDGEFVQKTLKTSDLEFNYRESLVKKHKNWIIGNSYFKLNNTDKNGLKKAKEVYFSHILWRLQRPLFLLG